MPVEISGARIFVPFQKILMIERMEYDKEKIFSLPKSHIKLVNGKTLTGTIGNKGIQLGGTEFAGYTHDGGLRIPLFNFAKIKFHHSKGKDIKKDKISKTGPTVELLDADDTTYIISNSHLGSWWDNHRTSQIIEFSFGRAKGISNIQELLEINKSITDEAFKIKAVNNEGNTISLPPISKADNIFLWGEIELGSILIPINKIKTINTKE